MALSSLLDIELSAPNPGELGDIAGHLGGLGVETTIEGTRLTCVDPVFKHRVSIDVTAPHPITPAQERVLDPAGAYNRLGSRLLALEDGWTPCHGSGVRTRVGALRRPRRHRECHRPLHGP